MFVHGMIFGCERGFVEPDLAGQVSLDLGKLLFETSRQNEQAHDLDDADAFLFDVVQTLFGVEDPIGAPLVRAVVAEDHIDDIFVAFFAYDRGDRVVLFGRLADDLDRLICPIVPFFEHKTCGGMDLRLVF